MPSTGHECCEDSLSRQTCFEYTISTVDLHRTSTRRQLDLC
ncbi:hypothetical protein [Lysobacter gummosus]